MFGRHSDLPLAGDATSRFLPWLVALMVFLATMAVTGAFAVEEVMSRWDHDVSGTVTVQVLPAGGERAEAATDDRVRQAVDLMRMVPGVLSVKALDKAHTLALLEPWLGGTEVVRDLPLPRLIDVSVDPDARIDLAEISERLSTAVPGASLDDHRVWLSRLVNLSRTMEWLAVVVVCLIGLVTSATVVYATRTGMAVHHDIIEVLHLIGAHDDYIARQFADRAFVLGLGGGMFGLAMAVPALSALGWAARRLEGGFLPSIGLPIFGYAVIALLPFLAAGLAMLTARLTVHGTLARMP
ncbi:cell division protein FtsX [Magnetospirillum molischianum]|uniref:Cell division protein n=1 Tax=Magnetospirillum molischianum DSM 120 TaxID=1150626 RepID=H8FN37_MAGML|nr:FtsX-like permease family protein [Magnetospirillum molischianum]CCG39775.1 Cell division protein [Magnetospirillum molischianum DSM 120]